MKIFFTFVFILISVNADYLYERTNQCVKSIYPDTRGSSKDGAIHYHQPIEMSVTVKLSINILSMGFTIKTYGILSTQQLLLI